jgi:hypothetical protein
MPAAAYLREASQTIYGGTVATLHGGSAQYLRSRRRAASVAAAINAKLTNAYFETRIKKPTKRLCRQRPGVT